MSTGPESLSRKAEPLKRRLGELRVRAQRHVAVAGGSAVFVTLTALALLSYAGDWAFSLDRPSRAVLLAAGLVLLGFLVVRRLLIPLRITLSDDDLAISVERQFPHLKDALINAVQFSRYRSEPGHDVSVEMMEAVEDEALAATQSLDFGAPLDGKRLGRRLGVAGFCALVLVVLVAAFPDFAALWLKRIVLLSEEEWPRRTHFLVQGFDEDRRTWVPKGSDFHVIAEVEGVMPRRAEIRYVFGEGRDQRAAMARLGEREFKHEFRRVLQPIEFRVSGGDGRTPPFIIDVVDRPHVESIEIRCRPPAYTGIAPFEVAAGQAEVRVPAGSEITIRGTTSQEVSEVAVRYGEEALAPEMESPTEFSLAWRPAESASLEVGLKDARGLTDDRPVRYQVRVVKDRAPRVKLRLDGIGDLVTPQAVIPMEIALEDDHGIAGAEVVWSISGEGPAEERRVPLDAIPAKEKRAEARFRWEIEPLELPTGEFLSLRIEAADLDDHAGPNVGVSDTYSLKVVSVDEFSTEMIRRQQEQRREWQRIIAQEKADRDAFREFALLEDAERASKGEDLQAMERTQRLAARQTDGIAERLEQVLEEMVNNRIAERRDVRRLSERVIGPLRDLAEGPLPASADEVLATRQEEPAAQASLLKNARTYDRILEEMNRILSNMLKIEGFTEVVAQLRSILQLQGEAQERARKAYREKIEKALEEF